MAGENQKELAFIINQSAANNLEESLETLIRYHLGLFKSLGESFKTTNRYKNILRQVGIFTDRLLEKQRSEEMLGGQLYRKSNPI